MNDIETSYFVQYPTLVAIFVLMVIVIAVLSGVVFLQVKKQQSSRPNYGFLGKPLALMFFMVLAVGSISLVYYSTQNSQDVGNVSADLELNLEINEQKIDSNIYKLNLVPSINTDEWGTTDTFNIYWTLSNTESFTRIELGLTEKNPGGIIVELKLGKNIVKAVVFTGEVSMEVTKEITL